MSDYLIKEETLNSLANSVRNLSGSDVDMTPDEMVNTINETKTVMITAENGGEIRVSDSIVASGPYIIEFTDDDEEDAGDITGITADMIGYSGNNSQLSATNVQDAIDEVYAKSNGGTSSITKVSQLINDMGYITGYTETDPTVPAWAKASTKPSYTAAEVGADPAGTADQKIAALINGAPSTLDTLGEIATAMQNNSSVVTALDQAIGAKADKSYVDSEINSLKTSVSEGKSLVAAAVTDKGVQTAANASFSVMANNISKISTLQLNGKSIVGKFASDVNIGDFITTESGKLEGMSMGLSYIHSTGANACWLNKDFGLWCDSNDPVNIGIMTNNNSHVIFQNTQMALTFDGNKSYTYYPRLFRVTDNIAIIANQRGNSWGNNGCDIAIHTLYCDGNNITQKSSYTISKIITHGSSGSSGSYPVFAIVPYNGMYKLLVAAGNPSTSSSDSDYSPSWGGAILTIDDNGNITHYRTTGNNYKSSNCVMYGAAGDDLSGHLFAFGYNAYYYCPNGSTLVSRYDSTTYNGLLTCTARNGYLYYTKSSNLYVESINGSTLTAVTNVSLGGYGHYIYGDTSGVYVYCYVNNAWHLKHYTFNGSTLTLQSDKVIYGSTLTGDIGQNYSYYGYDSYHISPVIKDSRYDDVFLISGSSNSKPLGAILNDDYYFIKATSSALGVKNTETTTSIIPNLI